MKKSTGLRANTAEASPVDAVVMPSLKCWIILDKDGPTDCEDEFGIGVINGVEYDAVTNAKRDIFESMQCALDGVKIPENAISAEFTATDFSHEDGQMTFPETGQWDFPPHWDMKLTLDGFMFIPDECLEA